MRDFYAEDDSRVIDYEGYNSAWEEDTQKAACNAQMIKECCSSKV